MYSLIDEEFLSHHRNYHFFKKVVIHHEGFEQVPIEAFLSVINFLKNNFKVDYSSCLLS